MTVTKALFSNFASDFSFFRVFLNCFNANWIFTVADGVNGGGLPSSVIPVLGGFHGGSPVPNHGDGYQGASLLFSI